MNWLGGGTRRGRSRGRGRESRRIRCRGWEKSPVTDGQRHRRKEEDCQQPVSSREGTKPHVAACTTASRDFAPEPLRQLRVPDLISGEIHPLARKLLPRHIPLFPPSAEGASQTQAEVGRRRALLRKRSAPRQARIQGVSDGRNRLLNVINFHQANAGAAILAGQNRGEGAYG